MKRLIFIAALFVSVSSFASVVQPVGAAAQVLIPAAGSTAGANGTFFHSDITIINLASHDQTVTLQWLPQADSGGSNMTKVITIPALTGIRSPDFVADYLQTTGLGSIIVSGVGSNGAADPSASIYVSARIWSPQPATPGAVSQSFPAIPLSTVNTQIAALFGVGGADNPANYRVNVGVVNLDPINAQTYVVSVVSAPPVPPSHTFTLPPMSMQQVALGDGISISTQIQVQNTTSPGTRSNLWTAYSSTVDDTTGDAWSDMAVAGTTSP